MGTRGGDVTQDSKRLIPEQTPPSKFGENQYDSYVDSDLWDIPSALLHPQKGHFHSGIVILGAQSSQNIDLTKFDVQLALDEELEKLGLRVIGAGELSLFKYVEEAEFGPGFPVNSVFVMGKLFDANHTSEGIAKAGQVLSSTVTKSSFECHCSNSMVYYYFVDFVTRICFKAHATYCWKYSATCSGFSKWMSTQSCLNWLLEVKSCNDRVGPSVVVALINDSSQSAARKLHPCLCYQNKRGHFIRLIPITNM
ncbi:uncharacterized protein LOC120173930 [Hibiscus syriacus]|uniref:uncharacterized protein LOC120173930 n=1 Tax=Hibiscus syriacus TaxID=106335 RepID=UPI001920DF8B|nr:uncharacterized protein LOC120173930 [Hibiscus syriacus]